VGGCVVVLHSGLVSFLCEWMSVEECSFEMLLFSPDACYIVISNIMSYRVDRGLSTSCRRWNGNC